MLPNVPREILNKLRASGQPAPWKCKLQLHRGRTLYGVEINAEGEITSVGGRTIYSASDVRFGSASIEDVVFYTD